MSDQQQHQPSKSSFKPSSPPSPTAAPKQHDDDQPSSKSFSPVNADRTNAAPSASSASSALPSYSSSSSSKQHSPVDIAIKLYPPNSQHPRRFQFKYDTPASLASAAGALATSSSSIYNALMSQIRAFLPHQEGGLDSSDTLSLTYVDQDGDHIALTSDADVFEAIRQASSASLRIYVHSNDTNQQQHQQQQQSQQSHLSSKKQQSQSQGASSAQSASTTPAPATATANAGTSSGAPWASLLAPLAGAYFAHQAGARAGGSGASSSAIGNVLSQVIGGGAAGAGASITPPASSVNPTMQENVVRFALDCIRSNHLGDILASLRESVSSLTGGLAAAAGGIAGAVGAAEGGSTAVKNLLGTAFRVAKTDPQTKDYLYNLAQRTGTAIDPWLERNKHLVLPAISSIENLSRNVNTMDGTKRFLATTASLFVPATLNYATDWASNAATHAANRVTAGAQQYFTEPLLKAVQSYASDPNMENVAAQVVTPLISAMVTGQGAAAGAAGAAGGHNPLDPENTADRATIATPSAANILQSIASRAFKEKRGASDEQKHGSPAGGELSRMFNTILDRFTQPVPPQQQQQQQNQPQQQQQPAPVSSSNQDNAGQSTSSTEGHRLGESAPLYPQVNKPVQAASSLNEPKNANIKTNLPQSDSDRSRPITSQNSPPHDDSRMKDTAHDTPISAPPYTAHDNTGKPSESHLKPQKHEDEQREDERKQAGNVSKTV